MKNFILLIGAMLASFSIFAQTSILDFEDAGGPYTFGDFGGGTSSIIDNPDATGINTSAKVAKMEKFAGATFGGTTITLPSNIDYNNGKVFKVKVWASREVPLTFKLEAGGDITRIVSHTGSSTWEELEFDFSAEGSIATTGSISLFFDNGVNGDAANFPNDWTFFYDDITQEIGAPPAAATFPVDFEDAGGPYTFNNFNGGVSTVVDNPDATGSNTTLKVVEMVKDGGATFGGTAYTLDGNIDFNDGKLFKMQVWSSRSVPVTFKLDQPNIELVATHSGSSSWEELSFDFSAQSSISATSTLVVIFDNGTVGDATNFPADWTFYYDEITQEIPPPPTPTNNGPELVVNGGFETAVGAEWEFLDQGGSISITDTEKRDGINSALIVADVAANGGAASFPVMNQNPFGENNVQPGDVVRVTFNMKAVAGTAAPVYKAALFSNFTGSGAFRHEVTFPAITGEWQTITADFTTDAGLDPANGLGIQFQADCGANPDCSANMYIDNVSAFVLGNIDTERPVITLTGSTEIEILIGSSYSEPGFSATDNEDGDITGDVVVSGDVVDVNTLGTYEIRYNVSDTEGNEAIEAQRFVTVREIGPDVDPSLIANGGFETNNGDGSSWIISNANGGTAEVIDTDANGGAYSVQLTAGESGGSPLLKQELFAQNELTGGEQVRVEFDIRATVIQPGAAVNAALFSELSAGATRHNITLPALTGSWQSVSVDITTDAALDPTRGLSLEFNPVCGAVPGCSVDVKIDNVSVTSLGGGGPSTALPVDFEDAGGPYTLNNFNGGASTIEDNPDASGINTSAKVVQMQKFPDAVFGGTTLVLGGDIDYGDGQVFKMKVWASRAVPITFKLEQPNKERVVSHSGSSTWEELTFDFSAESGLATTNAITIIFDNGVLGAADTDAANWTFYYDDISQETGGSGPVVATFPLDFEVGGTGAEGDLANFNGGASTVIDNPDASGINTSAKVVQMQKFPDAVFGGTAIGLDGSIDYAQGKVFKMKVWSSREVPVTFKLDQPNIELVANHSGSSSWEELVFDFSAESSIGTTNDLVVIFDNGVLGAADTDAANWTFYYDDITQSMSAGGGDTTAPVINLLGDATVNVALNDSYTDAGATATDDTDGDITADIVVGGDVVNTSTAGTYVITYNVSDAAGNAAAEVTRTVIEEESTTPPVITLLGEATVNLVLNDAYTDAGATATDDTDGDLTADIVVGGDVVNTSTVGTYVITYNVSDAAGNAAVEVTRTVIVSEPDCVNPDKPVITVGNDNSESVTLTSSSSEGNQWFLNGNAIEGATDVTLVVTSEGVYTVQVTVDDCVSEMSDDLALIVTSAGLDNLSGAVSVYPNPSTNLIQIEGFNGDVKDLRLFDLSGRLQRNTFRKNGDIVESDLSSIPNGVYLLLINNEESNQQIRIIKN